MANTTEKNMARFFSLMDSETVTAEDFKKLANRIIESVKKIVANNERAIQRLDGKANAIDQKFTKSLEDLKNRVDRLFVEEKLGEMSSEQKKLFNSLKGEFAELVEKKVNQLTKEIERRAVQGPPGEKGDPGRPPTAEEIEVAFQPTVEQFTDAWHKKVDEVMARRPAPGPNANAVNYIDLSDQCDGANKKFTIPTFRRALFLDSTQWPSPLRPEVDFTIGRKTLILTDEVAPPEAGQTLILLYVK